MRRLVVTIAMWIGAGAAALACPVCFQMEDSPMAAGVRAAVVVLVGVTVGVLGGFAAFMARIARRSREASTP